MLSQVTSRSQDEFDRFRQMVLAEEPLSKVTDALNSAVPFSGKFALVGEIDTEVILPELPL